MQTLVCKAAVSHHAEQHGAWQQDCDSTCFGVICMVMNNTGVARPKLCPLLAASMALVSSIWVIMLANTVGPA